MIASEEEDVPSVSFSASGTSRKPKCVVRGVLGPAVGGSSCVMDVGGLCRKVLVDAKARDERTRAGDARLRSSFDRGLILNPAAFKVYAKRSQKSGSCGRVQGRRSARTCASPQTSTGCISHRSDSHRSSHLYSLSDVVGSLLFNPLDDRYDLRSILYACSNKRQI
jgi:hypothetical protein